MKKIFIFLWSVMAWSQTEIVTDITQGGAVDFTNQPIVPQANFSRSQVIYYKQNLAFRGEINQIRYKKSFTTASLENSFEWVVKLGHTTLEEFSSTTGFIPNSELTEVFNGTVGSIGDEVVITFTTPFFYNGETNLVVQVQEITPGGASSGLSGFYGVEDFFNPPNRSIMTITDNTGTSLSIENSYPQTRFFGALERCIMPTFQTSVQNITQTSATINFQNNPLISSYRYAVYPDNTPIPNNLENTTSTTVELTNLLPAERYRFSAISECDSPQPRYGSQTFNTKPIEIAVPHTITFDAENTRDYFPPIGFPRVNVDESAADNSAQGLLFRSRSFQLNTPSFTTSGDVFANNSSYVSSAEFLIDLTNNPTNPVFTFRLKQKIGATFRVRLNNFQPLWYLTPGTTNDADFETIVIDLKPYVGQKITLTMEHVSDFTSTNNPRSSSVDSIELKEENCLIATNDIFTTQTTTAITVDGIDTTSLYDIAIVPQTIKLTDNSWSTVTLPFTFEGLNVASAYKIYVRKKCAEDISKWVEKFVSTLPETIVPPHVATFIDTPGVFVAPRYSIGGDLNFSNGSNVGSLFQRSSNATWVGGLTTTEDQAWNENKDFMSSLFMIVDAENMSSLSMTVRHRVRRIGSSLTSWFRILINGEQFGPSYNGTVNAQFQNLVVNLDQFVGTQFTVELQQTGRSVGFLIAGNDDRTDIANVTFQGLLSVDENQFNMLKLFPNPVKNELFITNLNNVTSVEIINSKGQLLQRFDAGLTSELQVDTSRWSSGIYYVKIKSNEGVRTEKIIKE